MPSRKQTLKEKIAARKREEEKVGIKRGVRKFAKIKERGGYPVVRRPVEDREDRTKWSALKDRPRALPGLRRKVYNNYFDRKHKIKK